MQETEIDIINNEEQGLMGKIKNWAYDNWQTILVVLIVLIVGMSAYNYNQNGNNPDSEDNSTIAGDTDNSSKDQNDTANSDSANSENKTDANNEVAAENKDQNQAANEDSSKNENTKNENNPNTNTTDSGTVKSTVDSTGKKYTLSAARGEGITHLARKALQAYLTETGQGSDLTPEHKVYIEDYMQNRTGNGGLEVGQQETFSEGLITEAISSAKTLSPKSLEHLKKYIK